jgi:thiol-disulfide isomerase/thioredoxin
MKRSCHAARSLSVAFTVAFLVVLPARGADPKLGKAEPIKTLTVRLVDADHKPVSGAHVGTSTLFREEEKSRHPQIADESGLMYVDHCVSDKNGLAKLTSERGNLINLWGHVEIIARHTGRGLIALADLDSKDLHQPVELTLVPECHISGKLVCAELAKLGRNIDWTNVYLSLGRARLMSCDSKKGEFHFAVPPGRYELYSYGTYVAHKKDAVTVPGAKREIEVTLPLPARKFALLMGHPAPELRDIAEWKNGPPLKLANLKGKCVLLEFWGYWCGPCVYRMPETFKLFDEYKKEGLVVIGVHVDLTPDKIDSVTKLDAHLVDTRKKLWHGRDLPFPVAVALPVEEVGSAASEDYGVQSYPTMLLIDRRGNLVDMLHPGPEGIALLQKTLSEKPGGQTSVGNAADPIARNGSPEKGSVD